MGGSVAVAKISSTVALAFVPARSGRCAFGYSAGDCTMGVGTA